MEDLRKYVAECIGTFTLVLIGCGTAMLTGCDKWGGYLTTAFAFGLVIVGMAYCVGNISGCHINPAVSLACLISGRMNAKDFGLYFVFQTIGAILAACVLGVLAGFDCGLGANGLQTLNEIGTPGQVSVTTGLIAEIVLTMLFVLVVLGATSKTNGATNNFAGLAIGLSLILIHLVGIHFTGTSVNPARSIGPALFEGGKALADLWVFIVGPLVGGGLAAFIWKAIEPAREE